MNRPKLNKKNLKDLRGDLLNEKYSSFWEEKSDDIEEEKNSLNEELDSEEEDNSEEEMGM